MPQRDFIKRKTLPYTRKVSLGFYNKTHIVSFCNIDAGPLMLKLKEFNELNNSKVTLTHCIIKITTHCLQKQPQLNSFAFGPSIYTRNKICIGIPVNTPNPTSQTTGEESEYPYKLDLVHFECPPHKTLLELSQEIKSEIKDKTEPEGQRKILFKLPNFIFYFIFKLYLIVGYLKILLGAGQLNSIMKDSVVISNIGVLTDSFALSIGNASCMHLDMMVGKIQKMPVVVDNQLAIRDILPLSLVFDHRIGDGADLALFWNNFKNYFIDTEKLFIEST